MSSWPQAILQLEGGDLVLVKASRGLHFEKIVAELLKGGDE